MGERFTPGAMYGPPQLCHAAASQLGTAQHHLHPSPSPQGQCWHPAVRSTTVKGHHLQVPETSRVRQLQGPLQRSLYGKQWMFLGAEKREGKKNTKNLLSVFQLFFCEGGGSQNFTDRNSPPN